MIEAFFDCEVGQNPDINADPNTYVSVQVGCVMPNDEIYEIARFLGIADEELFSVDYSTAFSRPTRIRCIVAAEDLPNLYRSTMVFGDPALRRRAAAVFKFRSGQYTADGVAQGYIEFPCWLMPPRPLHTVATRLQSPPVTSEVSGSGLFLVEAVDVKHWWGMVRCDATGLTQLADQHERDSVQKDNAAYVMTIAGQACATIGDALLYFGSCLPMRAATSFVGSLGSIEHFVNLIAYPQMSAAMAIDLLLAQNSRYGVMDFTTGAVNVYGFDGHGAAFGVSVIETNALLAGGWEPTSGPYTTGAAPSGDLPELWEGGSSSTSANGLFYQINRMPSKVAVDTFWRTVEGRTWNSLIRPTSLAIAVLSHSEKNYQVLVDVATTRQRVNNGTAATVTPLFNLPIDTDYARSSTPFSGNVRSAYSAYTDQVADRLAQRMYAVFGRIAFAGWVSPNNCRMLGPCTRVRWTMRKKGTDWLPMTERRLDEDDWIAGPSGRLPSDPKDLILARGNVYAKRTSIGPLMVDVPSPTRRSFAARITATNRIAASGNGYWRWDYAWEEVQRNADSTLTSAFQDVGSEQDRNDTGLTSSMRKARNSLEESNIYVAAGNASNFIAPGYSQSDYPSATMDCLPIAVGTVVTMWEDFPDCDRPSIALEQRPSYWFSLPNVPKFIC